MKKFLYFVAYSAAAVLLSVPASASFFNIPAPGNPAMTCGGAPYQDCTYVAPIPSPGTVFSNLDDNGIMITFSSPLTAGVVPTNWLTWAPPPFTESATPAVGISSTDTETITLSTGVPLFGFELEPESFNSELFEVSFYNGGTSGTLVGQVFVTLTGDAGARLFAGEVTGSTPLIDTVTITNPSDDTFAIAQVSVPTPEPMTLSIVGAGLLGIGLLGRRKIRK